MADSKPKNPLVTTPAGIAVYPWVNRPDTKFNDNGEYKIKLALEESDLDREVKVKHAPEGLEDYTLRGVLNFVAESVFEDAKANAKGAAKKKITMDDPIHAEEDDEGEATGRYLIKAKLNAYVKPKNKDGFYQKPQLLDAKKNKLTERVYPGSKVKLVVELVPYYVASAKSAGVSLRLKVVQVIELAEGGSSYDDMLDEEEGYESDDDTSHLDDESDGGGDGDDGGGDDDDDF